MALVQAQVNLAVDGAVSNIDYVRMHTGDPGGSGTSNVASNAAVTAISFPSATGGETEDTVEITISGAQAAMTHCSLWDGDPGAGGTYCGSGAVTPGESFAGAGTLELTVTVTGSSS